MVSVFAMVLSLLVLVFFAPLGSEYAYLRHRLAFNQLSITSRAIQCGQPALAPSIVGFLQTSQRTSSIKKAFLPIEL